jgi:hypothetical protein
MFSLTDILQNKNKSNKFILSSEYQGKGLKHISDQEKVSLYHVMGLVIFRSRQ